MGEQQVEDWPSVAVTTILSEHEIHQQGMEYLSILHMDIKHYLNIYQDLSSCLNMIYQYYIGYVTMSKCTDTVQNIFKTELHNLSSQFQEIFLTSYFVILDSIYFCLLVTNMIVHDFLVSLCLLPSNQGEYKSQGVFLFAASCRSHRKCGIPS